MPFVRLTTFPELSEEVTLQLAKKLTKLTQIVFHNHAESLCVLVEGSRESWVAGKQEKGSIFRLVVNISLGKHDDRQKERFVRLVTQLLQEDLGPINPASNVAISEISAVPRTHGSKSRQYNDDTRGIFLGLK
jgi:phenylpyruvate tautomerase PptA (4-oxalocrotonate tautomerase family)